MDANEILKQQKPRQLVVNKSGKKVACLCYVVGDVVVVGVGVVVGVVVVGRGVRLFRDSDRLFRLTDSRSLLFNTKVVPGAFVALPEQNSRLSKKI